VKVVRLDGDKNSFSIPETGQSSGKVPEEVR